MYSIMKPAISQDDIFDLCVNSIRDSRVKSEFMLYRSYLRGSAKAYTSYAVNLQLHKINMDYNKERGWLVEDVGLNELYGRLVNNKKPRKRYDEIKSGAVNQACPFCGVGTVSTLDHYMPKKRFSSFSISPENLVPSCSDCNKNKEEFYAREEGEQVLHPYFDSELFTGQWLFAEVLESNCGVTIRYFVHPPLSWNEVQKERVKIHFEKFQLATAFAAQTGSELSSLKYLLNTCSRSIDVRQHLRERFHIEKGVRPNHWKTAMYHALFTSNWFCTQGYKLLWGN